MAYNDKDTYKLLHDAYYGVGQFEDGIGLLRHPRESEYNYKRRQQVAYYLNYTGPIVNAAVDPVFRKEIRREYKSTKKLDTFLDDVDRSGADLQDYMRRMATYAKLYGVVYVVVNNVSAFFDSVEKNVEHRLVPYLTYVIPEDIVGWDFDEKNALKSFSYQTRIKNSDSEIETIITTWTREAWEITKVDGEIIEQGINSIGQLPIVQWFGRSTDTTNILPPSEYISIAQTNYHLYQICSWHTQLLSDQAFSILTVPSDNPNVDITLGTNNLLAYPTDATHTPSFIAPDISPANMLTDQIDRLIKEMYRMSGLDSVVGVQSTKSGVAKQWDFEKTNQRLADFAAQCESAELQIMKLYELWAGESIEYSCEYPRDYKINDTTESLSQAQQALDLGLDSDSFKVEVAKKVIDAYMPNVEDSVYSDIISEIESSLSRQAQDSIYSMEANELDEDKSTENESTNTEV